MSSRDVLAKARVALLRALGILSIFVVCYVGYAHFASAVTMREYSLGSYAELLGSQTGLSRFTVIEKGGLSHELVGDALHVRGTAGADGIASARFVGPQQRLDDLVQARLRYRVQGTGAFDVFVGFEVADKDPRDPDVRRVTIAMRNGAVDRYVIQGDVASDGPRRIVARPSPAAAAESDGGPATPKTDESGAHELTLELASYIRFAFGLVDGAPMASEACRWWMGTPVRLVFGVTAREPGAKVDVAFTEAAYEQKERPATLPPFHDRFGGKIIDPKLWTAILPSGFDAETDYFTDPTRGLVVKSRSKNKASFQSAITLLTPPTTLGSFSLRARFDARKLKASSAIIGVIGSGYSPSRFVDVGVHGDAEGRLEGLVAGHWNGDGQLQFAPMSDKWREASGVVAIKYDATSGEITAEVNGDQIVRRRFDLVVGDQVQIRVGATLESASSEADVAIREVSYDR